VTCLNCPSTVIHGRGLCWQHYRRATLNGTIESYKPQGVNRVREVTDLRAAGLSQSQVAERLGVSKNAVQMVERRHRGAGVPDRSVWEKFYVGPPPAPAACAGADPQLFDIYPSGGNHVVLTRPPRVAPTIARQVGDALSYCATCPLATQAWCLDTVRPRDSGASIVAGGIVWSKGRPVWSVEDEARAEASRAVAS
jgi:hypothetical protein